MELTKQHLLIFKKEQLDAISVQTCHSVAIYLATCVAFPSSCITWWFDGAVQWHGFPLHMVTSQFDKHWRISGYWSPDRQSNLKRWPST